MLILGGYLVHHNDYKPLFFLDEARTQGNKDKKPNLKYFISCIIHLAEYSSRYNMVETDDVG